MFFICQLLMLLFPFILMSAQETLVVGQVVNQVNKQPISSAKIFFKNTSKMAVSNEEGYFLIRNSGKEKLLIFSAEGYKDKEITIKPGESIGMLIELEPETFIINNSFTDKEKDAAIPIINKVREHLEKNDETNSPNYHAIAIEQNLLILNKVHKQNIDPQIYHYLQNASVTDSFLVVPMYMNEVKYQYSSKGKKEISKTNFSSPQSEEMIIEQVFGEINPSLNFYQPTVIFFGQKYISPLSKKAEFYYHFYLTDSILSDTGKLYEIHFASKNQRHFAFKGKFKVDSASWAITYIEASTSKLDKSFIKNLTIFQNFEKNQENKWCRSKEEILITFKDNNLVKKITNEFPLFLIRTTTYQQNTTVSYENNFAHSGYSPEVLNDKLHQFQNTKLMKLTNWTSDAIFSAYLSVGKIDIGKIQFLARTTELEGWRVNLPLRTNEKLCKNFTVGGYLGYGFSNQEVKYSTFAQYRLPGDTKRVLGINYTNDNRRIDYNYNNFLYLENPLNSGDEDIASTIFSFRKAQRLNERKELTFSFSNDWNTNVESSIYFRTIQQFSNEFIPFTRDNVSYSSTHQQSIIFSTRFSFDEKTFEDHLQRIYMYNHKPVIYMILEGGEYKVGNKKNNYGKLAGIVKQNTQFNWAQLNYWLEGGWLIGKVPYSLLAFQPGCEGGYGFYRFSMMDYMQYVADKYFQFHGELIFNGRVWQKIPVIKYLTLKEFFTFKMTVGDLSSSHQEVLDFPSYLIPLQKPYYEVGIGFANILHLFNVQSIWRFTENEDLVTPKWGIRASFRISF